MVGVVPSRVPHSHNISDRKTTVNGTFLRNQSHKYSLYKIYRWGAEECMSISVSTDMCASLYRWELG